MVLGYRWWYCTVMIQVGPMCSATYPDAKSVDNESHENDSCRCHAGGALVPFDTYGQAARRFTSTMPAATSTSAATSPGVTGSPSHSAPNSSANTGVRNTNTEILVAG